jgi:uncharacterized OsmC-like protein
MTSERVASAAQRLQTVLRRRPESGQHDDTPATVRWQGATRCVARRPDGGELVVDMPVELGGDGDGVTPGWLFRAGLASCAATMIAITAASRGIALERLEVEARSRSDNRGLFGIADAEGRIVAAAPDDVELHVRITAAGVPADRLRALVADGCRFAPVPGVVERATPLALHVDIAAD